MNYYIYLGNLDAFTKDLIARNFQPDEKKLNNLIKDFEAIFDSREYAENEISDVMGSAVHNTLERFLAAAPSKEDQKKATPSLTKILMAFPNKKFKTELQAFLEREM